MCGRFVLDLTPELVRKVFGITGDIPDFPARYNVAPSQQVLVVRQTSGMQREAASLRWGLIPSWAKDSTSAMINARSETAHEKPSFRQALRSRRCIIPANGFYEWVHEDKAKTPYYVRLADGSPLPFAGLWESWESPSGERVETCTILTTEAGPLLTAIHDRQPVILHPTEFDMWLDRQVTEIEPLKSLFHPYPAGLLVAYPVTHQVNDVHNDHPGLIVPVEPQD